MAIERSLRITCRLPGEILGRRKRRYPVTILSLSEKGFSLETELDIIQGDGVRLRLMPHRKQRSVEVDAIAWTERERLDRKTGRSCRVYGFIVSDPPDNFMALLEEVRLRDEPALSRPPRKIARGLGPPGADHGLPRPKLPLAPHKPDDDDSLPVYRVRLKQRNGPRSRSARVRARSEIDAAKRALGDLFEQWEVLEVRLLRS